MTYTNTTIFNYLKRLPNVYPTRWMGFLLIARFLHWLALPWMVLSSHGVPDKWPSDVCPYCSDYNDSSSSTFWTFFECLFLMRRTSRGILTVTRMLWCAPIIRRWLVIGCLGAFSNLLFDIIKSYIVRKFLHIDGIHNALAINVKSLSLIPHFHHQFWSNSCSMFFKSSEIIIIKRTWNWRITFYLRLVSL